jgi:hypothetical protein
MKEKSCVRSDRYLAGVLHSGCWAVVRPERRTGRKRVRCLLTRYRKGIDVLLSATAIGVMFLLGIWGFLIQLAQI